MEKIKSKKSPTVYEPLSSSWLTHALHILEEVLKNPAEEGFKSNQKMVGYL